MEYNTTRGALILPEYIPEGEFFIENFYAKFKHYPHTLHDFHADFFVDKKYFNIEECVKKDLINHY
jgi:hypothetical protein